MQSPAVDPRTAGDKPPFPKQTQQTPGDEHAMQPKPDYGLESYKGLGRLKDRVAVITGGDSGIGRAVAVAYAREGADIVVAHLGGVESPDARETAQAVEEAGRRCVCVSGDLTHAKTCDNIVEAAVQKFGRIDVLVNNAAYQGKSVTKFEELDDERIDHTFKTNIAAMFKLTRRALPYMKPGASVINVASIQAYDPSANILDYASTKGAIVAFTKGLAQELLPQRGIRVNAVAPGPVWTPLIAQSFGAEHVAHFGEKSPMGRPAQPKELAPAFVFLACEEGAFVNGEILGVTGGGLLA